MKLFADNSVRVHHATLQVFVTETYKVKKGIASEIRINMSELQNPLYNLTVSSKISLGENKAGHYGLKSARYLGPKTCELVSYNIKCYLKLFY